MQAGHITTLGIATVLEPNVNVDAPSPPAIAFKFIPHLVRLQRFPLVTDDFLTIIIDLMGIDNSSIFFSTATHFFGIFCSNLLWEFN
jgi:hypothetical protein